MSGGGGDGLAAAAGRSEQAVASQQIQGGIDDPIVKNLDPGQREEYYAWKGNAGLLYDYVLAQALKWPSLTVKWLPDPVERDGAVTHRLLLGTHTSGGEQNHLQIAEVTFDENGAGKNAMKFDVVKSINHPGEVNRVCYNPYNPAFVATKTVSGDVLVFDLSKHPADAPGDGKSEPQVTLTGHTKEGYAVEWSPQQNGLVASGADDKVVCVWDIDVAGSHPQKVQPVMKLDESIGGHTDVVEDLSWSHFHPKVLATCGDDRRWLLWDLRDGAKQPAQALKNAHGGCVNAIAFSPIQEHLVVTGGADNAVNLWDTRKLGEGKRLHGLEGHRKEVQCVRWSPQNESLLATSGQDARVFLWDLSKIGAQMSAEDLQDGPPELAFIHGGHCNNVPEVAWGLDTEWTLASVAEDNIIQIWQVAQHVIDSDDEDDDEPVE